MEVVEGLFAKGDVNGVLAIGVDMIMIIFGCRLLRIGMGQKDMVRS